jgi:hypothetical protein
MTDQKKQTLDQIIKYLLGEGELNGWHFGEKPGNTRPYWWRNNLREAWESYQLQSQPSANPSEKITLGAFTISPGLSSPKKMHIRHESGEGGDFSKEQLTELVAKFYWENF